MRPLLDLNDASIKKMMRARQEARHRHHRRDSTRPSPPTRYREHDRGHHVARFNEHAASPSSRTTKTPTTTTRKTKGGRAADRGRGRSARRRRPPPGGGGQEGTDRPHRRPGPHVPARNGRGRTALPRGRDRHRQAHRGRPRHHDLGPVRKPDHLQRHHRLVQRPQRRPHAAARDPRPRGDALARARPPSRSTRPRKAAKAREGEISEKVAGPSIKEEEEVADEPEADANEDDEDMVERRTAAAGRGRGRGQHPVARPDGGDAQAPGAREIRRDHLDLQEVLQGPGAPHGRARRPAQDFPAPRREEVPEAARAAHRRGRERPVPRLARSNLWSTRSTATTAA